MNVCLTDPADPRRAITVRLRGGPTAPLRARRSVLPRLKGELTETAAADLALIVSELVTNSVMHANVGPDQTLTVECAPLPDRLRLTVTDPGARLEPHLRRADDNVSGGHGLAIVASLSLAWGVVRDGVGTTSVWCELPLDTGPSALSTDCAGATSRIPSDSALVLSAGEGTMTSNSPAGSGSAVRPVSMPLLDRIASAVVTAVPPIMLGIGMWFGWSGALLDWKDLLVLVISYVVIGTGVTVGFHRLLTHRSFKTSRLLRAAFAALGSAAAEGPVIDWVATHRKHHQFSDVEGDPHSPHVGHGSGWRGAVRGLVHAHIGWVFTDMEVADERRYAKDLLADPMIRFVDRTFVVWVIAGLAFSFGLGVALTGSAIGGLTALLWGGAGRIFLLHHATFSINSLCHFFGRRDYETRDQSRNLAWLAIPTWGEAWHNNHHAFPTSYRHGLRRWQLDPSAAIIRLLELLGLAWDVVRIDDRRLQRESVTTAI
jgi:stearoyl-CoA desaturase (delta-9 desaturase)